ncbi:hypothetical protein SAMN06265222_11621 [Neorhodopirellula lusitana]|uniref:Secreted protein n=1 Tax=Neorhodopirellula lusitana TaxID=445327 RepID=A0ABY1QJF5_9BACT|nr:hypothetical protein SAMN06265222_11621 [Neorhodopirellula lusitana]
MLAHPICVLRFLAAVDRFVLARKALGKPVLWWFGATRRRATAVNSKHAGPAFRKHRAKASFRHRAKWDEAGVASARRMAECGCWLPSIGSEWRPRGRIVEAADFQKLFWG